MPKESESLNKKDNSSSELISIPPTPQVEEVLISDEEQTENDTRPYELKLNEKLRDLGLLEDDMTIQQKEELLAVVVASWETAEEEKTRRQFYQDYMNASEAFCNDQIEFSFKESPEHSNHALFPTTTHYLDIPLPPGSPNTPSYSKASGARSVKSNGNLNPQSSVTNVTSEIYEDEDSTKSSSELFTSSPVKSRGRSPRRGRSKRAQGGSAKQSMTAATMVNTQSTVNLQKAKDSLLTNKLPKKELEGQCISLWKPCLSPKDTPLSSSKRPWLNEPDSPCTITEDEYSSKYFDTAKELDFARTENLQRFPLNRTMAKPYYLVRRGQFSKKSVKPDKYDIMMGVPSKKPVAPSASEMGCATKCLENKEPFSRTSRGAFRYVKANRVKSSLPRDNVEAQTTRSGLRYGFYSTTNQNSTETNNKLPEGETAKDAYRTLGSSVMDSVDSKWPSSSQGLGSPSNLYSEVEVILDENLPKFNNLRPVHYEDSFSLLNDASGQIKNANKYGGTSKTKNHSWVENSEKQNHVASSSFVDNDSSNGSSVIDVESIVDDEIEEFVLKRKMLQEYQRSDKEQNGSQNKRLKKRAS